tara:strand:+ start:640 stop:834 length:195 start_codon:yes stop_codon:yes gene_type:complete
VEEEVVLVEIVGLLLDQVELVVVELVETVNKVLLQQPEQLILAVVVVELVDQTLLVNQKQAVQV